MEKQRHSERMNFRFPPETLRQLEELASTLGLTMTQVVMVALADLHEEQVKES